MGPSGKTSGCDPSEKRSSSLRRRYRHEEKPLSFVLHKKGSVPEIISDKVFCEDSGSDNPQSLKIARVVSPNQEEVKGELLQKRSAHNYAKCRSRTFNNKSLNYFFSLGNGLILILILLLVCWLGLAHGGFPGRGPPAPPRGPPLYPRHPLAGRPSRSSPFNRRRLGPPPPHHSIRLAPSSRRHHHPNKPPKSGGPSSSDLAVAAQTLYDLRGFHHQISGPDSPRFHRQNDPFTLPTPLSSNTRSNGVPHLQQDTRTAPLVFPSFYQEQPTPTPTRATIFGHNQHLSQTRFEPPGSFHLGGNSASTKITLEQQSSSTRDQFRPSQIDISLHGQSTPLPPAFPSFVQQQTQAPSSPSPEKKIQTTSRTRAPVKLNKNQQQDPFVYVYDEVDYDEADEDVPGAGPGRQRTPQNQINYNRITSTTTTTTTPAPTRSNDPQILASPSPNPYTALQQPQLQYQHYQVPNQFLFTPSTTTTKQPTTTRNSLFYDSQKDDIISPYRDPAGIIRPSVTPRPNVEIVPSSERRPPPDQSNAITPVLTRVHNSGRNPPQQSHVPQINDNYDIRTRRPPTTTSTIPPPTPAYVPNYQRESIYPIEQQHFQPQGRQVSPTPSPTPIPYFPAGLDRRPFEKHNEIPLDHTRNNHFNQVVNVLQEEEDAEFEQKNIDAINQNYNDNPSKLRPVNTIVPKNRIPKEDILLPPNFPYTHVQNELTTTLSPVVPQDHLKRVRGDPTKQRLRDNNRNREELPRIRDEVPNNVPYRNTYNQNQSPPSRQRPASTVYFPEDEETDNLINEPPSIPKSVPPPQQTPSRIRSRPTPQRITTTTTTTTTPAPSSRERTRTPSPRQRLRPAYNRQSTTTTTLATTTTTRRTTTTTTPAPTYVEYPSQEYLDDYDQPYQNPSPPPQIPVPVVPQTQKPISRFPPFPNKKEVTQEPSPSPPSPSSFQRHTQRPQQNNERENFGNQRQRPEKGGRFRDAPSRELTTSPRTTGKPLYTTGKMLSKEGGLYAGQRITSSHVYGQPIPNIPINGVLDKMPGVFLATTKPSFGSPQKHLRSKQRIPEHGPPSRINASGQGQRIRPTVRTVQENTLDIVETVTLKPNQEEKQSSDEPKRLRAGSQFVRGHQNQNTASVEKVTEGQQVLPRRRKVRPGRRPQQQQSSSVAPEAFTETVSIHPSQRDDAEEEDIAPVQQINNNNNRGQVIRDGQNRPPPQAEAVAPVGQAGRPRRPRPRPGKPNQGNASPESNVSERSREREEVVEEQPKPIKPVKKLRPRLRPVPIGQLNPQQQRGQSSETVVLHQAHSAQVDRKPTDAPGRFSSRFREDNYEPTISSTTPRGDDEERESSSSGPNRFSPSNVRPTFKPPPPKKNPPGRKRPQQQASRENDGDAIPESIKLSPKDVIANRKPARRIPPGSASDRLKALQQRRKKVFSQQPQDEAQTAEGRQVPVSKRPGFRPQLSNQEDDDRPLPPQRLQQRQPHRQSAETSGPKREVTHRASQQRVQQEEEYYNNENEDNQEDPEQDDDNSEYNNDDVSPPPPPTRPQNQYSQQPYRQQQSAVVLDRPPKQHGFHRNRSVEVTSDEARYVLGIPRPAAPNRQPTGKRLRPQSQDEELDDAPQFQQNRPRLRPRLRQRTEQLVEQEQPDREQLQQQRSQEQQQLQQQRTQEQQQLHQQRSQEQQQLQRPRSATLRPKTQFIIPQEDLEDEDDSEYQDDDKEEPPRRQFANKQQSRERQFSSSSISPPIPPRIPLDIEEDHLEDEEDEDQRESPNRQQTSTFVTTTTRTSSTSTSSSAQPLPVALPVRAGPQPIKQGALKARLRPNKRFNEGVQPRVSITASTTEATITTETRPAGRLKQDSQQKPLRPRLSSSERGRGGGGGGRNSKKFIAMATENPSLPLESIFPEMS